MTDTYHEWLTHDPDPQDRATLQAEIDSPDPRIQQRLAEVFAMPLAFGTAGLRGEMGPGPGRINTATVLRTTAGLSAVLHEVTGDGFRVVIGYDARHRSVNFAQVAAEVVTASGGVAELMPRPCPTPLLAFYLRESGADCGIMITASHNPATDNGYKVYLGGRVVEDAGQGVQLVAPWDRRIMEAITATSDADQVPRATSYHLIDPDVWDRYRREALRLARPETVAAKARANLRIVLTSLHGVGAELTEDLLREAGFTNVFPVLAQREPDPDFPTVAFPNPEETGVLDLAIAQARELGADLIIATDPDADRCSVAVPLRPTELPTRDEAIAAVFDNTVASNPKEDAPWRQLTGDEVGALLGFDACYKHAKHSAEPHTVARSVVSSGLLDRVARQAGVIPMVTLTGFKWIARTPGMIFGYEEALGLCPQPGLVRDKDGITAALQVALLSAQLRHAAHATKDYLSATDPLGSLGDEAYLPPRGTLLRLLSTLTLEHGLYHTAPLTFRVSDLEQIAAGMARLRAGLAGDETTAGALPRLGQEDVSFTLDLSHNKPLDPGNTAVPALRLDPEKKENYSWPVAAATAAASARAGWENLSQLPATDALMYGTDSGTRVVVRPSGTEPKLKCYLQVVLPDVTEETLEIAQLQAEKTTEIIKIQLREALGF